MINATSGISCTQGVRFTSGINAISGIKGTLPESYRAFYDFKQDDLASAELDQVNQKASVDTVRATNITISQTAGGSRIFGIDEAAFDVGFNMQVLGASGPTAATETSVSTFFDGVSGDQWPANDFKLSFTYLFEGNEPTQVVIDNLNDGTPADVSFLYNVIILAGLFRFGRRNAADTDNINITLPDPGVLTGREFSFSIEQLSTAGVTFSAIELGGLSYSETVTDGSSDFQADMLWNIALTIGSRSGPAFPANGGISELILEAG